MVAVAVAVVQAMEHRMLVVQVVRVAVAQVAQAAILMELREL